MLKKYVVGDLLGRRLFAAHFINEEVPGAGWNVPSDGYAEVAVGVDS